MKFKVGDLVKRTKKCSVYSGLGNSIGVVAKTSNTTYDYEVLFESRRDKPCYFYSWELEIVKRRNSNIKFVRC